MQRKKLYTSYTHTHINTIIFAMLFAGSILGGFIAVNSYGDAFIPISQNIYDSFRYLSVASDGMIIFTDSVIRHARAIILIWVLGFLHAGVVFQSLLIGMRGLFMGYGVSMFVMQFGAGGLFLAIPAIVLPNIFLIIILFFIIKNHLKRERSFSENIIALILTLLCAVVIGLYEAYISPPLCLFVFNLI